jgi:hypothetical protein
MGLVVRVPGRNECKQIIFETEVSGVARRSFEKRAVLLSVEV